MRAPGPVHFPALKTASLRGMRLAAWVATFSAAAGCQIKSAPGSLDLISVHDPNIVIRSVDRYSEQQASAVQQSIIVVKAVFTNEGSAARTIGPSNFVLLDLLSQTGYPALSGGDVRIAAAPVLVSPSKSADIVLGFRVPTSLTNGRLYFRP